VPLLRAIRDAAINLIRASRQFSLVIPRSKRALILGPFLTETRGHHLNFDIGFIDSLKRRGWSVRVLANRYASDQVIAERNIYRFFSSEAYMAFSPYKRSFWQRNADFYQDLRLLNLSNFKADNIVLLHTITVLELFGLVRWYEELPRVGRPRLIIYIQLGAEFNLTDHDEMLQARASYRAVARDLAKFPDVMLCASSTGLLDCFDKDHVAPDLISLPICWPPMPQARPNDGRIIFGYLGGARAFKGFHLVTHAISAILDTLPNAYFFLGCPFNPEFAADFAKLAEMGDRVRITQGGYETTDYYSQFDEVDVVLNAYDPARYRNATSMICLEAIGMGKGIITMDGTWSNSAAHRLEAAVVTMREFSSLSLAEAIMEYSTNHETFSRRAKLAQVRVREMHNVDTFLDTVGAR
jgi:hypothetical protein